LCPSTQGFDGGTKQERSRLSAKAIALCKRAKARLVIAKLDRLSRDVAFIATLMKGVDFLAVDNPHANQFTVHILAAVAEFERDAISKRTKEALAAAKARGVKLGDYARIAAAKRKATAARAESVRRRSPRPCTCPRSRQLPISTSATSRLRLARVGARCK
jgi:DNA invertase Pin-like site-specific DNA recombinase